MDVAMREDLVAAGMEPAQAEVLASHMPEWPDWSQLATKADLEQLATKAELKADLKELELNLQFLQVGLRENVAGLVETNTSIQKEISSLHHAVTDIRRGWLMRFGMPAIITIITGIAAAGLTILVSNQLP